MHATRDEPSILVVDDDDAAVAATARLLRTAGYRVASVSTGAECLSYVRNGAPKLVLLSAVLPDGDARDVCRQIKSDPSLAGIVVLFVFAHEAPPRDDVRGPESIADGYVVQPVPNDVLLAQIRTLLRLQAAEDGLRHAEETLARASALAKLGSATWDLERDESLFSDEWLRIHGCARAPACIEDLLQLVHPDDRPMVEQRLQDAIANDRPYRLEHRVIRQDNGDVCHIRVYAEVVRDASGRAIRVNCALRDVTEQKRAEISLRESERRYAHAETIGRFGHWRRGLTDGSGYWSPGLYRIFGVDPEQFTPTFEEFLQLVHSDDRDLLQRTLAAARETRGTFDVEYRIVRPDGAERCVRAAADVERDEHGQAVALFGTVLDVTEQRRAEHALRESEERHRAILRSTSDTVLVTDSRGAFTYVSPGVGRLFGYTTEEVLRLGNVARLLGDGLPDPTDLEEGAEITNIERSVTDKYARKHTVLVNVRRVRIGSGTVLYACRDITDRKQAEASLREHQTRLRLAIEASNIGFYDWDVQTKELHVTPEWKTQLGYAPDELDVTYDEWVNRLHPEDRAPTLEALRAHVSGDRPDYDVEFRLRHRDGTYRWISSWGEVSPNPRGEPMRMLGCHIDITARKHAEQAAREGERHLRRVVESLPVVLYSAEAGTRRVLFIHGAAESILGYPAERFRDDPEFGPSIIHPDDVDRVRQAFASGIASGTPFSVDHRIVHGRTRQPVWLHQYVVPITGADGRLRRMDGIVVDISERCRMEDELRQNKERLELAQRATRIGVWDWDLARNRAECNDIYFELYGLEPGGQASSYEAWLERIHPQDRLRADQAVRRAREGGKEYQSEFRVVWPDGSRHWLLGLGRVERDASGRPVRMIGTVIDITDRKLAEEALRKSESRFRALFNSAADAVLMVDANDGRFLEVNDEAVRRYQYSREELLGMTSIDLDSPEQTARIVEWLARTRVEGSLRFETVHVRRDGLPIPTEVMGRAVEYEGRAAILEICRDISERKRAEEAQQHLEEQLRQSQKMEAVGKLAGGVAHEFNNMLAAILSNAELLHNALTSSAPDTEESVRILSLITGAAHRAGSITRQLLTFGQKAVTHPEVLDLRDLIAEETEMLGCLAGERIRVRSVVQPGLRSVRADGGQIRQVLLNLVLNARDAMPDGGELVIEAAEACPIAAPPADRHRLAARPYVCMSVSDSGCGMDAETRRRMFDPFFTTKLVGKGSGLGLAVVHGIGRRAGGHITVDTKLGEGTTVAVWLPAVDAAAGETRPRPDNKLETLAEAGVGHGTVLVCEDEDVVREPLCKMLEASGFTVTSAQDGRDALNAADAHAGPIDALVTDMVMPGMSGPQLAGRLREKWPGLCVLYVSGYAPEVHSAEWTPTAGEAFVEKPCSSTQLLRELSRLMNAEAGCRE